MREFAALCPSEGIASERALLQNETRPLQAAKGFMIGSAVSGTIWTAAALLVWFFI